MFAYELDEVSNCLTEAKNLNAAVKRLMKTDAAKDERSAKFIKAFRQVAKTPNKVKVDDFVSKALPEYEEYLYLVCRNAYAEEIDTIIDSIISQHAETFNQSYSHDGSGQIQIEDGDKFEAIGKEALDEICSSLDSKEIPSGGFMRNAVAYSLFDRTVLIELWSRIGSSYT